MNRLTRFLVGLLALCGVAAAQTPLAQVREPIPRPLSSYVLRVVVATAPDVPHAFIASFPSVDEVFARTLDYAYHEVYAVIPATARGPFSVFAEGRSPQRPLVDSTAALAPGAIQLEIEDGSSVLRASLTGAGGRVLSDNALASVRMRHVNLGKFGWAQVYLSTRPGAPQVDVALNWHAGRVGGGDVLFRSARLLLPDGYRWERNLPDSAMGDGFLVRPLASGFQIIPERAERSFRFSVLAADETYRVPWSNVGTQIGLPFLGFRAPSFDAASDVDAWRGALAALAATEDGQQPVAALWPAAGVQYGGMTSGQDMHPLYGVRWMASGRVDYFERDLIEQLRYRSRHWGCMYGLDGAPVSLDGLTGNWRFYDSLFERGEVGPFAFKPRSLTSAAYNPEVFAAIDAQHLVREFNHNAALSFVGDDPLSQQYLLMEATKTKLTFWPTPGQRAYRWPSPVAGQGCEIGRANAWGAIVVAHAIALGATGYESWVQRYVDTLASCQMASGLFQINAGAKESKVPPYANPDGTPRFLIGSGLEECYLALGLHALAEVSSYARARAPELLARQERGMRDLAWHLGTSGVWSHSARGLAGTTTRFQTQGDWPPELVSQLNAGCLTCPYTDGYHLGYEVAVLGSDELLMRFAGTSSVDAARAKLKGLVPSLKYGGTPIEQWWPLLR